MDDTLVRTEWPPGGGQVGALLRSPAGAATPLGPPRGWPAALRIALGIVLGAEQPMAVAWGPALLLLCNDAAARGLGPLQDAPPGRPASEVWPQLEPELRRVLRQGETQCFRDRAFPPRTPASGRVPLFTGCISALRDEAGEVVGVLIHATETTRRVEAEQQLRRTEDFQRLAVEAGGVGTWDLDLRTQDCAVSPTMAELIGLPAQPGIVPGATWLQAVAPEHRDALTGALAASVRHGTPFEMEFRVVLPGGRERWLFSRGRIRRDAAGLPRRMRGASIDITARRQWEHRLRDSEAQFRAVFEHINVGMAQADPVDGRLLRVNQRLAQLLGYPRPELLGRSFLELTHPEDRDRNLAAYRLLLQGELQCLDFEKRLLRKDGGMLWARVNVVLIRDQEGRPQRTAVLVTDITARKAAEEALRRAHDELETRVQERTAELAQANAALKAEVAERRAAEQQVRGLVRQLFSAEEEERRRLSRELHDTLGQHLTVLSLGLKAVAEQDGCPAPVLRQLAQVRGAAQALEASADRLAHELRPPSLDALGLEDALRQHAEAWAAESGLPVEIHTHGLQGRRMPPEVETTVYRVVQEALTNVRRHAGAGRVALVVEQRGSELRALVEDDGQGFDAEAAAGRRPRRRLGLHGMRERAALAGGRLEIESTPGFGTTVYLSIPLPAAEAPPGEEDA